MNAVGFIIAHSGEVFSVVKQVEAAAAEGAAPGPAKKTLAMNLLDIGLKADGMSDADRAKWETLAGDLIDVAVKFLNAIGVFKPKAA